MPPCKSKASAEAVSGKSAKFPRVRTAKSCATAAASVVYESHRWQVADALRGSMAVAEFKHVASGLLFLDCASDAFEKIHARLESDVVSCADPGSLAVRISLGLIEPSLLPAEPRERDRCD